MCSTVLRSVTFSDEWKVTAQNAPIRIPAINPPSGGWRVIAIVTETVRTVIVWI